LCTGDVLQVGKCNEKADEWRLITLNNTMNNTSVSLWAIVLGANNEFIACCDTGDGVQDPYKKKEHPILKKPFPEGMLPSMGCGWRKAGPKRFRHPRWHHKKGHKKFRGRGKGHKKLHRHRKDHKKGHRPKWFRHHRED